MGSPSKSMKRLPDLFLDTSIADLITAGNAVFGLLAILNAICITIDKQVQHHAEHGSNAASINPDANIAGWRVSFVLLALGLLCDVLDGFVARALKCSSPFGGDMDSLADLISFGAAPAILGYLTGLNGMLDSLFLVTLLLCGLGRLARFNVTAEVLSEGTGKVSHFEGIPIPCSLILLLPLWISLEITGSFNSIVNLNASSTKVADNIVFTLSSMDFVSFPSLGLDYISRVPWTLHPYSLVYGFTSLMLVSKIKVPKPSCKCQRRIVDGQRDASVKDKHAFAHALQNVSNADAIKNTESAATSSRTSSTNVPRRDSGYATRRESSRVRDEGKKGKSS